MKAFLTQILWDNSYWLLIAFTWELVGSIKQIAFVQIQNGLLDCLDERSTNERHSAWRYIILSFVFSNLGYVIWTVKGWITKTKIAPRIDIYLSNSIYEKRLRLKCYREQLSPDDSKDVQDEGQVYELHSFAASEVASSISSLSYLCIDIPVGFVSSLSLLYTVIGPSSVLGLLVIAIFSFINSVLARRTRNLRRQDEYTSETLASLEASVLQNIHVIKLADLASAMIKKLRDARDAGLSYTSQSNSFRTLEDTLGHLGSRLVAYCSIATVALFNTSSISTAKLFITVSLLSGLENFLDRLVRNFRSTRSGLEQLRLIVDFLNQEETQKYDDQAKNKDFHQEKLGFAHATCSWTTSVISTDKSYILHDLNFEFVRGQLNIITGSIASGKSSMLYALLGEMNLCSGNVLMPYGKVAFCAQEPWLLDLSVKENILFGSEYDTQRYKLALHACALEEDLKTFPEGDETMIGPQGILLSGGQKHRIALARAMYSPHQCLLLDDPFRAVDTHTASWLFQNAICGPLMRNRTCILVCLQKDRFIKKAALVVELESGRVKNITHNMHVEDADISIVDNLHNLENEIDKKETLIEAEEKIEKIDDKVEAEVTNRETTWITILNYMTNMASFSIWNLHSMFLIARSVLPLMLKYWMIKLGSRQHELLPDMAHKSAHGSIKWYLIIYGILCLSSAMTEQIEGMLTDFGAIRASRKEHSKLSQAIIGANFEFLDATSQNTILSRFQNDMSSVDHSVPSQGHNLVVHVSEIVFSLSSVFRSSPLFLLPSILSTPIFLYLANLFVRASQDLGELQALTNGKLDQSYRYTKSGLVTIRAYGQVERFSDMNKDCIDDYYRVELVREAVSHYQNMRQILLSATVGMMVESIGVWCIGRLPIEAIAYSIQQVSRFGDDVMMLQWECPSLSGDVSRVGRIHDMQKVGQEESTLINQDSILEANWPKCGRVEFVDFTASYRLNSAPVITNINLVINPGERVGFVGRTGSGKSTSVMALLRRVNASSGMIKIDDVDISTISLEDYDQVWHMYHKILLCLLEHYVSTLIRMEFIKMMIYMTF